MSVTKFEKGIKRIQDNIPTKTSELENDSGFITSAVSALTSNKLEFAKTFTNTDGKVYRRCIIDGLSLFGAGSSEATIDLSTYGLTADLISVFISNVSDVKILMTNATQATAKRSGDTTEALAFRFIGYTWTEVTA